MSPRRIGIVGSGPGAAAAAYHLTEAGQDVSILDVGFEIEPHLTHLTMAGADLDRAHFLEQVRTQRRRSVDGRSALPPKLPFGSTFAYRPIPPGRLDTGAGVHIEISLALGGLSNVWGANVCALAQRDMDGWPITEAELAPYFNKLDAIVDVSGTIDAIDEGYAARLSARPNYPLSLHGRRILTGVERRGDRLSRIGLRCGRAKIAVGPRHSVDGIGCTSCGLCMHGCPHRAIFNAADVVRSLRERGKLRYLGGRFALRFAEDADGVTVVCRPAAGGALEEHRFDSLLIACGVLGSTAIVARSLNLCSRDFLIRDSQKYYFPYLRYQRAKNALEETVNTLAQVFIQDVGMASTPRTVHCQLYGVNELFFESLRAKLGGLATAVERLGTPLLERLMIGMVYFHSADSGSLRYRVAPREEDGLGRVEAEPPLDTRPAFTEFMQRLAGAGDVLGGRPLPFLAETSPPGHSMHFGGTLPMTRQPGPGQTDVLGRPFGCRRVHVVDTSVFPSIPGTPTTYPLMANALRICDSLLAGRAG